MSWFKKGEEARKALEEREKLNQQMREKSYVKFYLKPDSEAPVIFVDDEGFWCEVHTIKAGNGYKTLTCSAGMKPCAICVQQGEKPQGVLCFTIIDLRPYVKRDGTVAKFTKSILMAKRTLAKQLEDYKKKFGSLVGMKFILKRYTDKDTACGIVKDVVEDRRYNLLGLGKEYAVPYDYEKVLAPPTDEELRFLGFHTPTSPPIPDLASDGVLEEDIIEEDVTEEIEEIEPIEEIAEETEEAEETEAAEDIDVESILEGLEDEEEEKEVKPKKKKK